MLADPHEHRLGLGGESQKHAPLHGAVPEVPAHAETQVVLAGPAAPGGVDAGPDAVQPHLAPGVAGALPLRQPVDVPAARPAFSATMPMIHGMIIAPRLEMGSSTPMLVAFMIRPVPAMATGLTPAIAKANAKSSTTAMTGVAEKTIAP